MTEIVLGTWKVLKELQDKLSFLLLLLFALYHLNHFSVRANSVCKLLL